MNTCTIIENTTSNSEFFKIHADYMKLTNDFMFFVSCTDSYFETLMEQTKNFCQKHPSHYSKNLIQTMLAEIERHLKVNDVSDEEYKKNISITHKDYWKTIKHCINGDRTDSSYWDNTHSLLLSFYRKHKTPYAYDLTQLFLHELSERTREEFSLIYRYCGTTPATH